MTSTPVDFSSALEYTFRCKNLWTVDPGCGMATVRRTFDLDPATDARLNALAAERSQDAAAVVADAVTLLDSLIDVEGPGLDEDLRRLREFERTGEAVPLDEVKAWVESWGTPEELPRPAPRKVR
jgi:predicted transcriptional regulator